MDDASLWGVAWALVAVAAGVGLTVAAMSLFRGTIFVDQFEFDGGYNALAPQIDRAP